MKLLCIVIDLRHLQVVFLWIQQATMHRLQHCFHDPKQIKSCGFNWYKMCTFQATKECFRSLTSCQLWTSSSLLFFALWTWTNWHTQRKKKTDTSHMNIIKNQSGEEKSISFHNGTPKLWSHLGSLMLSEMLSRIYKIHISTSKSKFFQSFSNLKHWFLTAQWLK